MFLPSLPPDRQEEARTHQEQARPEERKETTEKITAAMDSSSETNTCEEPRTTNEDEHRGRLSGTWSHALLIRAPPCGEEVSYLARSRTVLS